MSKNGEIMGDKGPDDEVRAGEERKRVDDRKAAAEMVKGSPVLQPESLELDTTAKIRFKLLRGKLLELEADPRLAFATAAATTAIYVLGKRDLLRMEYVGMAALGESITINQVATALKGGTFGVESYIGLPNDTYFDDIGKYILALTLKEVLGSAMKDDTRKMVDRCIDNPGVSPLVKPKFQDMSSEVNVVHPVVASPASVNPQSKTDVGESLRGVLKP